MNLKSWIPTALAATALSLSPAGFSAQEVAAGEKAEAATTEAATTGRCVVRRATYKTSTTAAATSSTTFQVLPDGAVGFTQGGKKKKKGCVLVRLSAIPKGTNRVVVRAVMDGTVVAEPGEIDFAYATPAYPVPKNVEFVFPVVKGGKHVVRIEWMTPGPLIQMYDRTISVLHR